MEVFPSSFSMRRASHILGVSPSPTRNKIREVRRLSVFFDHRDRSNAGDPPSPSPLFKAKNDF